MEFKVGDRVVAKESSYYSVTKPGWRGEVVQVEPDRGVIRVRALPGYEGGADTFGVIACHFAKVRRNSDRKIVVTVDGETTTARLYNGKVLEKSAEAKCSPGDRFDFNVGAGLAIDRLLDREATKPGGFPLEELKSGRFGRLNNGEWFVVLEDRMLYLNGNENWDKIADLDGAGMFPRHLGFQRGVNFVVDAVSLKNAKRQVAEGQFIWARTYKKV